MFQEQKLKDEIDRLVYDLKERDAYIESRKSDITTLESLIFQSREGFNNHKTERDRLQDERKYAFHAYSVSSSYWNCSNLIKCLYA